MKPCLKSVAEDLYRRFGGNLDNVAVVFPNKRAGLFFNEYLLECSGSKPIWSPRYMTISELFQQNSELVVGDSILLVSIIASLYCFIGKLNLIEGMTTFDLLTNLAVFSCWIFYTLTFASVIQLRKTMPNAERKYKVPLYSTRQSCSCAHFSTSSLDRYWDRYSRH